MWNGEKRRLILQIRGSLRSVEKRIRDHTGEFRTLAWRRRRSRVERSSFFSACSTSRTRQRMTDWHTCSSVSPSSSSAISMTLKVKYKAGLQRVHANLDGVRGVRGVEALLSELRKFLSSSSGFGRLNALRSSKEAFRSTCDFSSYST